MLDIHDLFWNSSIKELTAGYSFEEKKGEYICLICGHTTEKGIIYKEQEIYYDAEKFMKRHIQKSHSSTFDYLLNLNKKFTGITDHQKELLHYFYQGLNDREITKKVGGSESTIRNHRFKLKEKEKQAKVFLAIMTLLKTNEDDKDFVHIHKGATMVDDRYAITEKERQKVLDTYFDEEKNRLSNFPSKEKRKIIVLQQIIKQFEINKEYTEKEVNEVLKLIFHDFATIRRYLIEYGFMQRNKDGSSYWVKK